MKIPKEYIYEDDEGKKLYDYCESCKNFVHQEDLGDEIFGCEHCKNPNQIYIYEV